MFFYLTCEVGSQQITMKMVGRTGSVLSKLERGLVGSRKIEEGRAQEWDRTG